MITVNPCDLRDNKSNGLHLRTSSPSILAFFVFDFVQRAGNHSVYLAFHICIYIIAPKFIFDAIAVSDSNFNCKNHQRLRYILSSFICN